MLMLRQGHWPRNNRVGMCLLVWIIALSFGTVDAFQAFTHAQVPHRSKLSTLIQAGNTFEETYSEEDLVAEVAELRLNVNNARKYFEVENRNVLYIEKKIESLKRDVVAANSAVEDASRILGDARSVADAEQDLLQTTLLEHKLINAQTERDLVVKISTNAIDLSKNDLRTAAKARDDANIRYSNAQAELKLVQARLGAAQKRVSTVKSLDVRCSALSEEFLRENSLGGYADAAIVCKEKSDVKAVLDSLENLYEEPSSFNFPFGSIVTPSGTGKTQLAATAAASGRNVHYLYTGLVGDSTQRFYQPHADVRRELFNALEDVKEEATRQEVGQSNPLGAPDICFAFADNKKVLPLFTLLSKLFLNDDSPSTFDMLQNGIRRIPKNRRVMVFLDEVPSTQTSFFNDVLLLRNVLRALGVCPILMSTHSGASNAAIGSDSRQGDDDIWCRIFTRLPQYHARTNQIFRDNRWLVKSEHPLVASMLVSHPEKDDLAKIVDHVRSKLQIVKPGAWTGDPGLQLLQLLMTESGWMSAIDMSEESKRKVVGVHFGHINVGRPDFKDLKWHESETWIKNCKVQFVDPQREPVLFLALTSWKIEHLQKLQQGRLFPLVSKRIAGVKEQEPMSVIEAFYASTCFRKPVPMGNPLAQKLDGNVLEVLALASMTLASLQYKEDIFDPVTLPEFLSSTYNFMMTTKLTADGINSMACKIQDKLEGTPFVSQTIPTCASTGSSFAEVWQNGGLAGADLFGKIRWSPNSERRDGTIEYRNGTQVLHFECKNHRDGITTAVFKKIMDQTKPNEISTNVLFASSLNNMFTGSGNWTNYMQTLPDAKKDACVLVLGKEPRWLEVEQGNLTLSPVSTTNLILVVIETGPVESGNL